jgi:hypothetical protein
MQLGQEHLSAKVIQATLIGNHPIAQGYMIRREQIVLCDESIVSGGKEHAVLIPSFFGGIGFHHAAGLPWFASEAYPVTRFEFWLYGSPAGHTFLLAQCPSHLASGLWLRPDERR